MPESVAADLEGRDLEVTRLEGAVRQETAAAVADWTVSALGWRPTAAVLARPDDFPDALAAAPFAGNLQAPILLAGTDDAADTLASVTGCTVATLYVAGGELAVSDAEATAVAEAAGSSDACDLDVRAFPQQAVVSAGEEFTVTADLLDRDGAALSQAQVDDLEVNFTVTADTFSVGVATPTMAEATVAAEPDGTASATFTSNSPGLVVVEVCGSGADEEELCDTSAVRFAARYALDSDRRSAYINIADGQVCLSALPTDIQSVTLVGPDDEYGIDGSTGCVDADGLTSAGVDAAVEDYFLRINGNPAGLITPIGNDYKEWEPVVTPEFEPSDVTVSGVDLIGTIPETNGVTALNFMTVGETEVMVANGQFGLKLYDMADPTAPALLDEFLMPDFWQNEDVDLDDDRDLVFLSRDPRAFDGSTDEGVAGVYIFDVSDPTNIVRVGFHELPAGHTATCVRTETASCDFLWSGGPATGLHQPEDWGGRPVFVTDVRDPAKPFTYPQPLLTEQNDGVTDYAHDVQVDSENIAWVSSRGGVYGFHTMGEHTDPLTGETRQATPTDPIPVAGGGLSDADAPSRFMHNSFRPVGETADEGADLEATGYAEGELIYITEEAFSTACESDGRLLIASLEGSESGEGFVSTPEDPFRLETVGIWSPTNAEGQSPDTFCSAHYFEVQDSVLVQSWYLQGTRFLDVSDPANPRQIAYYRPSGGVSFAPYFYEDYVIVADISRGIEITQLNADADTALAGSEEVLAPTIPAMSFEDHQALGTTMASTQAWEADPIYGWSCAIPAEDV